MAFVDGSSSGNLTGMRWGAYAAVGVVEVIAVSPSSGNRIPSSAVPLNVIVTNTATGGTDVQFQVATDSSFTTIVAAPSASSVPNGPLTVTATGLPANTGLFWRARGANAGTTGWSPWSATMDFLVDLNAGKDFGYVYENLGIAGTLYAGEIDYVFINTGIDYTVKYAGEIDYVFENVGFQIVLHSQDWEYAYEGDVSTNQPTPHIWFLWLPYGFAGDEVWAYGHGLGNPQSEYGGQIKVDPGPSYSTSPDSILPVNEWYLQEAVAHAYDDERIIYAGAEGSPPVVTSQVEIIRWVVPDTIVPTVPTYHHIYVTHSTPAAKTSNLVNWLMYPTLPTAMGNVPQRMRTDTVIRLSGGPLEGVGIEQLLTRFAMPAYTVRAGRPEAPPLLQAGARSSALLGTWDTEEALVDALGVTMGSTRRWLPDEDLVVPGTGTGVTVWNPSVGSSAMAWRFDPDSTPYIDPEYVVDTRLGEKVLPAMVFPGDSWGTLTANVPNGPAFSFALVAVLHPPPDARSSVLLGTWVSGSPTTGAQTMSLTLEGDRISLVSGGRLASETLQNVSRRPVIITGAVGPRNVVISLMDAAPSGTSVIRHPFMNATNLRLYLGRDDMVGDALKPAAMDVLEFNYWDHEMNAIALWKAQNKLDSIYGVSGSSQVKPGGLA